MLPRDDLLQGCPQPQALEALIERAEQALRTWEPQWSGFVSAELRELAQARLGPLTELRLSAAGGWPQAERCRLLLQRAELMAQESPEAPLCGLVVSGNFLFDPSEPADVRQGLQAAGMAPEQLGDIWMRGDRGAQAVLASEAAERWQGVEAQVRSVPVRYEARPIARPKADKPKGDEGLSALLPWADKDHAWLFKTTTQGDTSVRALKCAAAKAPADLAGIEGFDER